MVETPRFVSFFSVLDLLCFAGFGDSFEPIFPPALPLPRLLALTHPLRDWQPLCLPLDVPAQKFTASKHNVKHRPAVRVVPVETSHGITLLMTEVTKWTGLLITPASPSGRTHVPVQSCMFRQVDWTRYLFIFLKILNNNITATVQCLN